MTLKNNINLLGLEGYQYSISSVTALCNIIDDFTK